MVWYLCSVLVLSIILTLISIPLFDKVQHTEVLPFDTKDKDLDGKTFSEGIIGELSKIQEVVKKPFEKAKAERLPIPVVEASNLDISERIKDIDTLGNKIAETLGGIGNLSITGLELPIGPFISALYRCRRIGKNGCVIQGSLQRYDKERVIAEIEIIRLINGEKECKHCKIDGEITDLPDLIKDISFEIAWKLDSEK